MQYQPEDVRELYMQSFRVFSGKPNYGRTRIPRWDGGTSRFGAKCKPVWDKLAQRFTELQINPSVFIPWYFAHPSCTNCAPTALLSEVNVQLFRAEHNPQFQLRRAEIEFQVDLTSYEAALTPALPYMGAKAVEVTLNNEDVCRATALFRYCFAKLYGLHATCAKYFASARHQYLKNPQAYDVLWDRQLLADLRTNHG